MAFIWFAREGDRPTLGEFPNYTRSLDDCRNILGLKQRHFVADLSTSPKFGEPGDSMAEFRDRRHVIIVVHKDEAKNADWRPGFYRLSISPEEARDLLDQ